MNAEANPVTEVMERTSKGKGTFQELAVSLKSLDNMAVIIPPAEFARFMQDLETARKERERKVANGELPASEIHVKMTDVENPKLNGIQTQNGFVPRVFTSDQIARESALTSGLIEPDALAGRRSDSGSQHEQQMVNALLQQIDIHRDIPGLVLVAATNRLDEIDPAAIREGRFDYKVKIYKPDFDARREILDVLLRDRPHDGSVGTTRLAQNMEGFSAAQIRHVVDEAALAAMESEASISDGHLSEAYNRHITKMRYQGVRLTWNDLILPDEKKRKLQFIEKFIENPDVAQSLGIEAPRGVLLFGPPGTGKTTIARVLASETDASFFAINAADIFSKWLGESEQHVKELFEKARENVPALIFIDEIEAVMGRRSAAASGGDHARNAVINTFLAEMDGMESNGRIFVIGATNRPELLDEAALRPGRLSESVEIGLPSRDARLSMLRLFSKKMRLDDSVDLENLAEESEGASGADLKGLCTAAGRNAFLRALEEEGREPAVTLIDFRNALKQLFPESGWEKKERPIGFQAG